MRFPAAFIDTPATLLQSIDEAGSDAGISLLTALVPALAIGAIVVLVRKRLWKCPGKPMGRLPVLAGAGAMTMVLALLIGTGAAGMAMSLGLEDADYARLTAGVASNAVQAALVLFFIHSSLCLESSTPAVRPTRAIAAGIAGFLLAAPIVAAVGMGIGAAQEALGAPRPPSNSHETLRILIERRETLFTLLTLTHVAVLVPLAEESLWRGLLQPSLRRAGMGGLSSVVVTALLFTGIHWSMIPADGRFAALAMLGTLALVLGILRERTGGTLAPIVLHGLFNAANVAIAVASAAEVPVSSPP